VLSRIAIFVFLFSHQNIIRKYKIDVRLVGAWVGEEEDKQMQGVIKQWEMLRDDSENFKLLFKVINNGKVKESVEVGKIVRRFIQTSSYIFSHLLKRLPSKNEFILFLNGFLTICFFSF
jgi:hypothetical protein